MGGVGEGTEKLLCKEKVFSGGKGIKWRSNGWLYILEELPATEEVDVCIIPTGELGWVCGCDKVKEELPTRQSSL